MGSSRIRTEDVSCDEQEGVRERQDIGIYLSLTKSGREPIVGCLIYRTSLSPATSPTTGAIRIRNQNK